MSDPGRHAALFDGLPRDTGALAETVQGLLIHRHIAPAYGVTLSRDQQAQSHLRAVEKILDDIVTRDGCRFLQRELPTRGRSVSAGTLRFSRGDVAHAWHSGARPLTFGAQCAGKTAS